MTATLVVDGYEFHAVEGEWVYRCAEFEIYVSCDHQRTWSWTAELLKDERVMRTSGVSAKQAIREILTDVAAESARKGQA